MREGPPHKVLKVTDKNLPAAAGSAAALPTSEVQGTSPLNPVVISHITQQLPKIPQQVLSPIDSPQIVTQEQWAVPSQLDCMSTAWSRQLTPAQQMVDLRTNPQVQAVTTGKMAELEHNMEQNVKRKKSGRANVQDPPELDPTIRWPNKVFPIGENTRRLTFDELNQYQCTQGFITNVMQVSSPHVKNTMLAEYSEILQTAHTGGWNMAKVAFAAIMSKIEEGRVKWTDANALFQLRFNAEKTVLMSQGRAPSIEKPFYQRQHSTNGSNSLFNQQGKHANRKRQTQQAQVRKFPCRNYNGVYCAHGDDHDDPNAPVTYLHICDVCYRAGEEDNRHKYWECPKKNLPPPSRGASTALFQMTTGHGRT